MLPVEPGLLSTPMLIGRERELEALHAFLARGGGMLLISGEAGIGKSRLVREAMATVETLGFQVLQGACFEQDQALPYAPFLDLSRSLLAAPDSQAKVDLAAVSPRLRRLLPELTATPAPAETESDPERERRRVFHEVEELFARLASERPLLVVIEDIHWSDETSLELLLHLARRATECSLALLITYRGDETTPRLSRFLAEVDRRRIGSEIALRPLTPAEVEQQIRTILDLPRPAGSVFVRSLHGLTGGNPFFVEEVLRSLIAAGDVYPSDEGWQRKPLDQLRVPRSVADAVARRTALLGADAREVLILAAVAGRRFDFALLQALSGLDEAALLAAVKELIAAHLLIEVSADLFAFRHALTRQAVYADLLARERRALHARVARAIEDGTTANPDAALADLAYHHFEAGNLERAGALARAAGDRARGLFAPYAAIEHYTRALAAAESLAVDSDPTLRFARGQAFDAIGDFDAAHADYKAALTTSEARGDTGTALSALLGLGLLWSGRDYDRAHAWLTRALELARAMDDPAALAQALNRIGNWHANHEDIDAALRDHEEALAIFERLGDQLGVAQTLDLLAMTVSLGGDLTTAQQAARRAADIFAEFGDRQGLAGVLILTAMPGPVFELASLAGGASVGEGVAVGEQAVALAREIEWRSGEAFHLALLGEVLAASGEFGRSLTCLRESIAIAEEIDHRQWIIQARWGLARLYGTMLLPEREREELEQVLALAGEIHSRIWVSSIAGALASTLIGMGELDAAAALLAETAPDDTPMRTQGQRLLWTAHAELALARGRPGDALAIADRLYASAVNLRDEGHVPLLARLKAKALVALGEYEPSAALLRAAQQTAREEGALPMLRSLHLALAGLLHDQNQLDEASVEERAAREVAARLAATMPDDELRAGFMAAAGLLAGEREATRPESHSAPGSLTPREREVAAHVAAGRANREIAEELFVSERTVEAHVANILRKLGDSSRAGIAAWAVDTGLARPGT